MGERKVLNKYYPPDFDPAKLPRNKRPKTNDMKVRMMLPMSVRCKTCGTFMYKGTKFNTRKEDVLGETYLGIQIFRFYYRCSNCAAEFTMKTDPKTSDYLVEEGAIRNYEPWRDEDKAVAEVKLKREEEEMGNAMKQLENRTLDSKREMDIMSALDEMRSLNARHAAVTPEQALAALMAEAAKDGSSGGGGGGSTAEPLPEEDEAALRQFLAMQARTVKRLSDDDSTSSEDERGGDAGGGAGPSTSAATAGRAAQKGKLAQPGSASLAPSAAAPSSAAALPSFDDSGGSGASSSRPAAEAASAAAQGPAARTEKSGKASSVLPFKVMVKPKRVADAEGQQDAAKRAKPDEPVKADSGGGLGGLLGYGSDSDHSS